MDQLLLACQRYKIHSNGSVVQWGPFVMSANAHSTGVSVSCSIASEENEAETYTFLRGTFWFSSRYTFNEFLHEHGAWDGFFDRAIAELWARVDEEKARRQKEKEAAQALANQRAHEVKAKFESQFKSEPKP